LYKYSLKKCEEFRIPKNDYFDLELVLKTYNFGFWFNGEECIVIIDNENPAIGIVELAHHNCTIYAQECINEYTGKIEWILGLKEDLREFHE